MKERIVEKYTIEKSSNNTVIITLAMGMIVFSILIIKAILEIAGIPLFFSIHATVAKLVIFIILLLACIFAFLAIYAWKIVVNGQDILYRNIIGAKKLFLFSEIEKVTVKKILGNETILVYVNNRQVFRISSMQRQGYDYFLNDCEYFEIEIIHE